MTHSYSPKAVTVFLGKWGKYSALTVTANTRKIHPKSAHADIHYQAMKGRNICLFPDRLTEKTSFRMPIRVHPFQNIFFSSLVE